MSTTVSYKGNTIATLNNETKTLTTAGTWVEGNITVTDTKDNPTLQAKTNITPIQSSQTITADSGYDGLSSVQINAIPENYKDSIIFTATYDENTGDLESITCNKSYSVCSVSINDAYDYSAIYVEKTGEEYSIFAMQGREVYDPSSNEDLLKYTLNDSNFIISYYQDGTITVTERNASATTPATTITANPSISVNSSTGVITATASASQSITPTVVGGYISSGTAGTVTVSGSNTSQLSIQAGTTITPNESEQTAVSAGKYTTGAVKVGAISSTYVGSGIDRRDETDLTASGATVTVPAGFYAEQETKSVASGIAGTPTATKGSVSNHSISVTLSVTNTTGYITGGTNTGTAVMVSASELVSGTLSITSSGTKDVTNYASASVAAGTEGTPTATKGTVSNHQITVTPSVTNTTGYIEGGTKTGTAVTVSASELVSGTLNVSSSGTKDVTNYAAASIPAGTEGTPSATKGTVSNHQVTVTPSVTNSAGYITGSTKTGTAITVTASELASGNKEITQNGTNIDVVGYSTVSVAVPSSSTALITDTTDTAGGTIRTITTTDEVHLQTKTITPTSSQQTVLPDTGYDGFSSVIVGASSGGSGSSTQHTIHLEFSDSTETDISLAYSDSLIGTMITSYEPSSWTYNNKTVVLAELDNVSWYDKTSIPLNTELVDYTTLLSDSYIEENTGSVVTQEWYYVTDYIAVDPSMTFSYKAGCWTYIGVYNSSNTCLRTIEVSVDGTVDSNNSNFASGTLSGNKLTGAAYVRLSSPGNNSNYLSLIRTA